jgi:hypothetical protein
MSLNLKFSVNCHGPLHHVNRPAFELTHENEIDERRENEELKDSVAHVHVIDD